MTLSARIVLLAALAAAPAAADAPMQRVGVLKFETTGVDASGQVAGDLFSAFLTKSFPGVSVVERTQLEKVLSEQQLQYQSGVIDRETAARLQKVLGVDSLVLGSVVALDRDVHGGGGTLMMTARRVDTTSGQILWAETRTVRIHESEFKRLFRVFGNPSTDSDAFVTNKLLELAAFELVQDLGKHLPPEALVAARPPSTREAAATNESGAICSQCQEKIRTVADSILDEEGLYWAHRLREEPSLTVTPGGAYADEEFRQRLTTRIFLWLGRPGLPPLAAADLIKLAKAKLQIRALDSSCEQARTLRIASAN